MSGVDPPIASRTGKYVQTNYAALWGMGPLGAAGRETPWLSGRLSL